MKYTFEKIPTALGVKHVFKGPGMPYYAGAHFMQVMNDWAQKCTAERIDPSDCHARTMEDAAAETVARLLDAAFEAGRQAKAAEVRAVLEVPRTR